MILKYFNNPILFFLVMTIFIMFQSTTKALDQVKIIHKINNEIITNIDIYDEYKYLVALNNQLKKIDDNESFKIAEESLVREKIKVNEIKKYFVIENFDNDELIDTIIESFYKKLGINNQSEYKKYLDEYDVSLNEVKKKIKIEILWNQLIGKKFASQISIDENKLKKKIKENKLNVSDVVEYDLSEIVFQAKNQKELENLLIEIKSNIESLGFNTTANKFSISNSAKFGGEIGKIKENQLTEQIKLELNNLEIGQYTKPIKISSGFMIILINDKLNTKVQVDEKKILKEMIEFETNNQYERFSQIYYNKIKLETQIND